MQPVTPLENNVTTINHLHSNRLQACEIKSVQASLPCVSQTSFFCQIGKLLAACVTRYNNSKDKANEGTLF